MCFNPVLHHMLGLCKLKKLTGAEYHDAALQRKISHPHMHEVARYHVSAQNHAKTLVK